MKLKKKVRNRRQRNRDGMTAPKNQMAVEETSIKSNANQ
jgi:hypothetical protein